ncbi:hypothetical protein LTR28_000012 [Elasticomyces elasticus]|nr:hypothetical protein LTR28_000012 [Elasticomyces elasticus]
MALKPCASTQPAPLVVPPDLNWSGIDGNWSTFPILLGSSQQAFSILISTTNDITFVPNLFNDSLSNGGDFGLDTVGLQLQDSVLSTDQQIIGSVATRDFYLGLLGLGTTYTNFSTYNQPLPSLVWTLKNQSRIPSLSYGYTAGASYRYPGSLTLGGYDKSRFEPSNVDFTFPVDTAQNLTVGIQSITTNNTLNRGGLTEDITSFTSGTPGHLSLIDSKVPHIWLPRDVCDRIEQAFRLTYNPRSDLYVVNNTIHTQLVQLNPALTFRLGSDVSGGNSTTIVLPYSAFDLVLAAGFPYSNATHYFPIRRAANASQHTIGRAFLQEAYLVVDYERSTFSVNQAAMPSPLPQHQIIAIPPPVPSPNPAASPPVR